MPSVHQDPGSFRDPLSRVFVGEDRVVRAFTAAGKADLDAVWSRKSIAGALSSGDLIESTLVDPAAAGLSGPWAAATVCTTPPSRNRAGGPSGATAIRPACSGSSGTGRGGIQTGRRPAARG